MDKEQERRKRLAALPFSDKLKILDKLRVRSRAIAASGLRKTRGTRQPNAPRQPEGSFAGLPFSSAHLNPAGFRQARIC